MKKNYKTGSTPRRPHASWKHRAMWPDACEFVAAGDIEHGDLKIRKFDVHDMSMISKITDIYDMYEYYVNPCDTM